MNDSVQVDTSNEIIFRARNASGILLVVSRPQDNPVCEIDH
jgi:hypothetical protein